MKNDNVYEVLGRRGTATVQNKIWSVLCVNMC